MGMEEIELSFQNQVGSDLLFAGRFTPAPFIQSVGQLNLLSHKGWAESGSRCSQLFLSLKESCKEKCFNQK